MLSITACSSDPSATMVSLDPYSAVRVKNTHDAFPVHFLIFFAKKDLALEFLKRRDQGGRGTGMEAHFILNCECTLDHMRTFAQE
jgi:hypothetical protein